MKLLNERKSLRERVTLCQCCGNRAASDLHEIYSRAHIPLELQDELPDCLHSLLCTRCNSNHWFYPVDSHKGRQTLLCANVRYYGIGKIKEDTREFLAKLKSPVFLFDIEDIFSDNCRDIDIKE